MTTRGNYLQMGDSKSCGCLHRERAGLLMLRHGDARRGRARATEYRVWAHMIGRCHTASDAAYADYGGRGISVCEQWRVSYEQFRADMGARPSKLHSIDRINNDGNYEPGNCRWATHTVQTNNSRRNHRLTHNGETRTIAEWARHLGVSAMLIAGRIYSGWTTERALSTPPGKHHLRSAPQP